jgi:hypothetical protein
MMMKMRRRNCRAVDVGRKGVVSERVYAPIHTQGWSIQVRSASTDSAIVPSRCINLEK